MGIPNPPPKVVSPGQQMFQPALGLAPGLGRMKGRRILVVGGGQRKTIDEEIPMGNGRGISRVLGREGASLAILDASADAAESVVQEINSEGGKAQPIVFDVLDHGAVPGVVEKAAKALGGLDGLVLNVGKTSVPMQQVSVEDWDAVFALNVRSHMQFARKALEVMDEGSSIVLISSLAALRPGSRQPAYEASKAAQLQLTRSIALEGEPRGIRCNCLILGLIDSGMGRDEGRRRPDRANKMPFGRQGTGWEVGYAALFLLSHEASYVNAQDIRVDGGHFYGILRP
jgi:NAD(P)-dependent dehydrogenase (short-subunit alcohol dehydrogenase family)